MNWGRSLLFFGIPGLLIYVGIAYLVPLLTEQVVPLIVSWTLALWGPIVLLLAVVMVQYTQQPNPKPFSQRFRFHRLTRRDWLLILGALLIVQVCELFLAPTGAFFAQFSFFAPPAIIPDLFNPTFRIEEGLTHLLGVPVQGNWWLVLFWLGWLVINIGGEELLWRGYALPLQEEVFGRYAWLVNGLLWNLLIHYFMRWNFLTLMPISLIIPYLVQRQKIPGSVSSSMVLAISCFS
ncbi:MAG: CPBP family glutamic-type intramembrane protease [Chloroflexota bacterium]